MKFISLFKGTIVRGNWSTIEYKVEFTGKCQTNGWGWATGRCVTNPLQSGSFNYLGERVGNEISITDPKRPDDKLMIIKEPKQVIQATQMKLTLEY